ncbi:uncharacterized protein LOC110849747 isoform X1 [Folsomia candida]|uniref:uncharacterized protein LOC110849747 isoform X1 n=1 Tax=Folsomia candida TaxID=158441 RepID=UPI001605237D|nr:uncharacterized protein LOC110849747 isoform X1 [Folsomia candida]XP_035707710.1 uncharacterized protein LOC110849747 isoform X1 [Folsomia candida]
MATKCDLSDGGPCFICGSPDLASKAQPRRRYAELTTLFKTLVMTTDLQKNLADSVYSDFTINVESCFNCLATIKDVCDLRQEIVTLQTELDRLLEGARIKLGNILPNPNLEQKGSRRTSQRNSNLKRAKLIEVEGVKEFNNDSIRETITSNDDVEIKEEHDDLFDMDDAEIIPDSVDFREMHSSSSEANDDNKLPNNITESESEDYDEDPDYNPPTPENVPFNVVATQRNKPCLQYQNYSYTSSKKRGLREYWRCRTRKCTGRLIKSINNTSADAMIISKEHNCMRSAIEVQVENLREELKAEALKNPLVGPRKIISTVKAKYSAEVVQALHSDETLLSSLRRMRRTCGANDPKSREGNKEDGDNLFDMDDAEIIPDSIEFIETHPSINEANEDKKLRNDTTESGDEEEDPTTPENMSFNISLTQRNKPCLQYKNYSYTLEKGVKGGLREYWKCRKRKCAGRLIKSTSETGSDTLTVSKKHNCMKSSFEVQVDNLRNELKAEALKNPHIGPTKIVSTVKAKYSAEVIQALPDDETLFRNIRRMRKSCAVNDRNNGEEIS